MKIGASSLAFFNYSLENALRRINEIGFEAWEIVLEGKHYRNNYRNFKNLLSSYSLPIFIHAPFSDLNIASLNEKIRQETLNQIYDAIEISRVLDALLINIHPGRISPLGMFFPDKARETQIESLKAILDYASNYNLTLCVENSPNFYGSMFSSLDEIQSVLNEDGRLFLTLDVGHAHTCGDVIEYFRKLNTRIRHLHLHDNDGKSDMHMEIGKGTMNIKNLIPYFKKYEYIMIESKNEPSAVKSKETLESLISL
jgi:sugar phosphate isomerase/epimerase